MQLEHALAAVPLCRECHYYRKDEKDDLHRVGKMSGYGNAEPALHIVLDTPLGIRFAPLGATGVVLPYGEGASTGKRP